MHPITNISITCFQAVCFVFAGYMIHSQIQAFISNEDLSVVSYRPFNQKLDDTYPTISICVESMIMQFSPTTFKTDKISRLFTNFNATSTHMTVQDYFDMLRGNTEINRDFHKIHFDNAKFDFMNNQFLDYFVVKLANGSDVDGRFYPTWRAVYSSGPMFVSYQDPYTVCISKKFKYMQNVILQKVKFMAKVDSSFMEMQPSLKFYIHEDGQLIQMLSKPQQTFSYDDLEKINNAVVGDNAIHLHIHKIERLHKRTDAVVPCEAKHEDLQFLGTAMQMAQCIPSYWKRFMSKTAVLSLTGMAQECTKTQHALHA